MTRLIITSGSSQGQSFELDKDLVVVGRDTSCDVVLEEGEVSRRHAELRRTVGGVVAKDLGSTNGTRVHGVPISVQFLKHGDEVVFGSVRALLEDPAISETKRHGADTNVSETFGSLLGPEGRVFPLDKQLIRVGRDPDSDLVLDIESISARHAELRTTSRGLLVKDLDSTNGTFVNGEMVGEKLLMSGDEVTFDILKFKVSLPRVLSATDAGGTRLDDIPSLQEPKSTPRGPVIGVLAALALVAGLLIWWVLGTSPGPKQGTKGAVDAGPQATIDTLVINRVWSFTTGGRVLSSPAVGDIDGNGVLDVVVGSQDGKVYALHGKTGRLIWAVIAGGPVRSSPVLVDLTGDKVLDVVVGTSAARVLALDGTERPAGTSRKMWDAPRDLEASAKVAFRSSVAAAVMAPGRMDLVAGASNGRLYRISGTKGTKVWDSGAVMGSAEIVATPVLSDVNGDGVPDALVGSTNGRFYCLDGKSDGWKIWDLATKAPIKASACLADINGDGKHEVIVASSDGTVYVRTAAEGAAVWSFEAGGTLLASPVVIDYNRDNVPDVVVALLSGDVICIDGRGRSRKGAWKYSAGSGIAASPVVFDFNRDGVLDVLVVDRSGVLHVINGITGRELAKTMLPAGTDSTPAVADINGDGLLDVVVGTNDNQVLLLSFNRPVAKGRIVSGLFRSNLARTGR